MANICALAVGLLAALGGTCAAAETVVVYRGRLLMPHTGGGVPHARNLHFKVSGHLPKLGGCRSDFTILSVDDGAFSLKDAQKYGFTVSPENRAKICSDAKTGALSETLYAHAGLFSGGNLIAAYTWSSSSPRRGPAADSVVSFANIEYRLSEAKRPGRLMVAVESDRPDAAGK